MVWNLDDLNPPEWFTFPQEAKPQGKKVTEKIALRHITQDMSEEIMRACSKKKVEHKHPTTKTGKPNVRAPLQRIEYRDVDDELAKDMYWDQVIADWELYDPAGAPIPCSKKNKLKLVKGSARFVSQINAWLERMQEQAIERAEQEEKNS